MVYLKLKCLALFISYLFIKVWFGNSQRLIQKNKETALGWSQSNCAALKAAHMLIPGQWDVETGPVSPVCQQKCCWSLEGPHGEGNGTPLQYCCLENPMDGGAWWAAVHGVAKSRTRLSDFTFTFHFPALEKEMATHSSVLAWRIQGRGSLVGCRLWGRTESDTTEVT